MSKSNWNYSKNSIKIFKSDSFGVKMGDYYRSAILDKLNHIYSNAKTNNKLNILDLGSGYGFILKSNFTQNLITNNLLNIFISVDSDKKCILELSKIVTRLFSTTEANFINICCPVEDLHFQSDTGSLDQISHINLIFAFGLFFYIDPNRLSDVFLNISKLLCIDGTIILNYMHPMYFTSSIDQSDTNTSLDFGWCAIKPTCLNSSQYTLKMSSQIGSMNQGIFYFDIIDHQELLFSLNLEIVDIKIDIITKDRCNLVNGYLYNYPAVVCVVLKKIDPNKNKKFVKMNLPDGFEMNKWVNFLGNYHKRTPEFLVESYNQYVKIHKNKTDYVLIE